MSFSCTAFRIIAAALNPNPCMNYRTTHEGQSSDTAEPIQTPDREALKPPTLACNIHPNIIVDPPLKGTPSPLQAILVVSIVFSIIPI